MYLGRQPEHLILKGRAHSEYCKEYKYLGIQITEDRTAEAVIRGRNLITRKSMSLLNNILWDKRRTGKMPLKWISGE